MPLVLPPTVLGFYLLITLGRKGPFSPIAEWFGEASFAFTFTGLVIGSVIYSAPFVIQPLVTAFRGISQSQIDIARLLNTKTYDRFLTLFLPLARPGFIGAAVLGFAHTLGEFGVILMLGGNIPGETRVASIAIYDHVEGMDYENANELSLVLILFAFGALLVTYGVSRKRSGRDASNESQNGKNSNHSLSL